MKLTSKISRITYLHPKIIWRIQMMKTRRKNRKTI